MVVGGGSTANFCWALLSLEVQRSLYSIFFFLKHTAHERRDPVWTSLELCHLGIWETLVFKVILDLELSWIACLWRLGGNWNTRPTWKICDLHTKASWWQAIVLLNMRWQSDHLASVMPTQIWVTRSDVSLFILCGLIHNSLNIWIRRMIYSYPCFFVVQVQKHGNY